MVPRKQVIELAETMPVEKLARWYEYGLFIQAHPLVMPVSETAEENEMLLMRELAVWEAASDEDSLKLESMLTYDSN